jgi:hypothetical protein
MALGQALDIWAVGNSLFQAVVDHFAARSRPEYQDLPPRRYLATGDSSSVAWDCEQFTVSLEGIGAGSSQDAPAPSRQPGVQTSVSSVRYVTFMVSLVRCTPTMDDNGNFPPVEQMAAAGDQFLRDAGLLSQAVVEWGSQMRRSLGPSSQVVLGDVLPAGPEGKFAGLICSAQVGVTTLR